MLSASLIPVRPAYLAMAVVLAAMPATVRAQETELQGVRLGTEAMSYEAPRLIVRGSRLSETELRALLDPAATSPWSERVMKLEAEEILAPELIATIKLSQIDQRTTYRDVSLKRVGGGKIASLTSSLGAMEGTQQGKKVTGSNGAISMDDIDVGAMLGLLTAKAGPAEPLRRLYGGFSIDAVKVIDSTGITTQIGRMSGREFAAKPTSAGWMQTINTLAAADPDKATPGEMRGLFDGLAEMLDSVYVGSTEASDISLKGRVEKDDVDLDISMKKLGYTGAGTGRGGEFRIDGAAFSGGDARMSFGTLAFSGLDAKPLVQALREIALNPENPSPAVVRRLLPALSSIRLDELDADFPPEGKSGATSLPGERTRFGIGRFEIAAEKPVNGIPSDTRIVVRNVAFPVPANSKEAAAAMLTQLGYDRVDGSLGLSLAWNEAGQELVVRDLSLDAKDMGTATLRGVVGRVGRDVFDEDTAVASVALATAAAKSIDLKIDNRGLFERIIARESRRQKRPAEDVRREYGMAASVGIPAILGNSTSSKALAQAVSRFVAKPGTLTIQAKAKQAAGFGLADYMANPTPAGVLEAVDITASAQ